jgi:hypothetical protein
MEIVHKAESYAIMGACFEVYREMGCGFTEPVYLSAVATLRDRVTFLKPE